MTRTEPRRCVDSGVVVAAFAPWHERHSAALSALHGSVRSVAHSLVEAYSVLTRLPAPYRAPAEVVADFLGRRFPLPPLQLDPAETATAIGRFADAGIRGGAAYDALIGLTAASNDHVLLTLDRRAATVYRSIGCAFEVL